jgi:hypothetical protein
MRPDPNTSNPVPGANVTRVKPTITRQNIIVGDFTYYVARISRAALRTTTSFTVTDLL